MRVYVERREVEEAQIVAGGSWGKKVEVFKVVAYTGPGVNFPIESAFTTSEATAKEWAGKLEAGEGEGCVEARFAQYADD